MIERICKENDIEKVFKERDLQDDTSLYQYKTIDLKKETEYRMRLEFSVEHLRIKLYEGQAEIFGAEMTKHHWYKLPSKLSLSIYTWSGCSIIMESSKDREIQSYECSYAEYEENPNYFLANCFININGLREKA